MFILETSTFNHLILQPRADS